MSFELMQRCFDLRAHDLSSAEKTVLVGLARYANNDGTNSYPSIPTLAACTCLNQKTVRSALSALADKGYVFAIARAGASTLFNISLDKVSSTTTPKNGSTEIGSTKNGTTENGTPTPAENGSTTPPKNGTTPLPNLGGNSVRKKPLTRSSEEEEVARFARPARFVPEEVQTGEVSEQAFADYQTVRKAKRAGPVTPTSWSRLKREAAKASLSLQAAVELCAERGWTSVNSNWESLGGKGKNRKTTPEHDLLHATAEDFKNKNWYEGATRLPDGTYRI